LGENLISGNDVVRMASVFGESLIDDRAMRIAQRYCRGIGGKALPEQFHKVQPLCGRQLEDFCDVSITHDWGAYHQRG
jgi:hypothetical protein